MDRPDLGATPKKSKERIRSRVSPFLPFSSVLMFLFLLLPLVLILGSCGQNNPSNPLGSGGQTTSAAPLKPQAVAAPVQNQITTTSGDGQVIVTWDPYPGAQSYNLYWSNASQSAIENSAKIQGVSSPYTHSGLTNDQTYYYFVTAVVGGNEKRITDAAIGHPSADPAKRFDKYYAKQNQQNTLNLYAAPSYLGTSATGTLRIELTWSSLGDVDLHVWEPSGEHVYFGHGSSASGGYLDRDNTYGYGPENYINSTPPQGDYGVKVHYWSDHGYGPTNATVKVYAGSTLLKTYGPTTISNNQWWDVGLVNVKGDCAADLLVPYYSQNDPAWATESYDDYVDASGTPYTIGQKGCALTDWAMILSFHGTLVTPSGLNSWLMQKSGFDAGGFINPRIAAAYGNLAYLGGTQLSVEDELCKGNPGQLWINGRHWVVAKSKTATSYNVNDPISGQIAVNKANVTGYLVYGKSGAKPNYSGITITALSPVELLLIDPLGRKTGYDYETGTIKKEMPGTTFYGIYQLGELAPGEHPPLVLDVGSAVNEPFMDGQYTLKVYGTGTGPFKIHVSTTDSAANKNGDFTYTGVASPGMIDTIKINHSGTPGQQTVITKYATFESTRSDIQGYLAQGKIDNQGIVQSLIAKLNNAEKAKQNGQTLTAQNIMNAFINEVQAQKGQHIAIEAADALIQDANDIMANMNQPI